ncbi:hypothetical protein ABIE85_006173 [Bradyrhizobium diazoefficiens]|uniref:hypothetical protein n=1 Tax=Bradyrhizobium diazoefficiens TaxID=1355477 RepID=UPI003512505A
MAEPINDREATGNAQPIGSAEVRQNRLAMLVGDARAYIATNWRSWATFFKDGASWIAIVIVPIVLAIYAYKADDLAQQQLKIADIQEKHTQAQIAIQNAQTTIQGLQSDILKAQNELIKLQFQPNFSVRINETLPEDEGARTIEVFNTGASVRNFRAYLYRPSVIRGEADLTRFLFEYFKRIWQCTRPTLLGSADQNSSAILQALEVGMDMREEFVQRLIQPTHCKLLDSSWSVQDQSPQWTFSPPK